MGKGSPGLAFVSQAQLSSGPCCASSVQPQYDGSASFLLFDESDGEEEEELMDKDEEEEEDSEISGCGGLPFWSEESWLCKGPVPDLPLLVPDGCCLPT